MINFSEKIDFCNKLKEIRKALPLQTVLNFLNENNFDYQGMSDIDMYILYLENVDLTKQ